MRNVPVKAYWLGYFIPPNVTNPGFPWHEYGDTIYANNSRNLDFASSFFAVDALGNVPPLPSRDDSSQMWSHWCGPTAPGES